jgi:hypothetical protein
MEETTDCFHHECLVGSIVSTFEVQRRGKDYDSIAREVREDGNKIDKKVRAGFARRMTSRILSEGSVIATTPKCLGSGRTRSSLACSSCHCEFAKGTELHSLATQILDKQTGQASLEME